MLDISIPDLCILVLFVLIYVVYRTQNIQLIKNSQKQVEVASK
jgi:hypothetical protein